MRKFIEQLAVRSGVFLLVVLTIHVMSTGGSEGRIPFTPFPWWVTTGLYLAIAGLVVGIAGPIAYLVRDSIRDHLIRKG